MSISCINPRKLKANICISLHQFKESNMLVFIVQVIINFIQNRFAKLTDIHVLTVGFVNYLKLNKTISNNIGKWISFSFLTFIVDKLFS